MAETIRVHVIKRNDRKSLFLKAVNTETGETFRKSSGTADRKQAEKLAIRWQVELEQGSRPESLTWLAFVDRYVAEHSSDLRKATDDGYRKSLELFAKLCSVKMLRDANSARVGRFRQQLAKRKNQKGDPVSKSTINRHLRQLKAALRWAEEKELLNKAPAIKLIKSGKAKKAKGRPVSGEEFDRMIAEAERWLPAERVGDWLFFLRGLWWSGLRLEEAYELSWDEWSESISVDLSGEYGVLRIPAEAQKNGEEQLLPIAPEFAELLRSVPEEQREGCVFNPGKARRGYEGRATLATVKNIIRDLGKKARVLVGKDKFASAHDLRRSFGSRWSLRVKPVILQQMMRHKLIQTTMDYYVEHDAQTVAAQIQAGFSLGSQKGSQPLASEVETTENTENR